jgi:hypothetical protein
MDCDYSDNLKDEACTIKVEVPHFSKRKESIRGKSQQSNDNKAKLVESCNLFSSIDRTGGGHIRDSGNLYFWSGIFYGMKWLSRSCCGYTQSRNEMPHRLKEGHGSQLFVDPY